MQQIDQKEKDGKYREELMQKWLELQILTDEEMKFLADTSELLNRNIDRTRVERVIELLDPEVLHQIELKISDQVIEKYEQLRDVIKQSRNNFVLEKAVHKRE